MSIYIMIARQRSGTGALNSIVSQHKDIVCIGEVFHPNNLLTDKNNYFYWLNNEADKVKFSDPVLRNEENFQNYLSFIENKFPGKKILIDIKYRSLHHFNGGWISPLEEPAIFRFIRKQNIPCLHLTRDNLLETYVSGRLAEMNKVWHAKSASELQYNNITIDIDALHRYINFTMKEISFVKEAIKRIKILCEIDYKNMLLNNKLSEPVAKKLETFFECSDLSQLETPFIKQVAKLESVIENYDDVRRFLKANNFDFCLPNSQGD